MQYTLDSVTAPSYAFNGDHGYRIAVGWSGMFVTVGTI